MTPNKLPTNIDLTVSSFTFSSGAIKGLKTFFAQTYNWFLKKFKMNADGLVHHGF